MSGEEQTAALRLENLSETKRALLEKRLQQMRAPVETTGGDAQIPHLDRTGPIPASYSQERMWLNYQINPQSLAYNSQVALHFTGELDVTALELTLQDIVRRHEVCRTELYEAEGEVYQRILPYTGYELPIVDFGENPGRTLRDFIDDAITTPFQLDRAPLVRWTLVRESPQRATLICTDHHAVTDGWSRRVVFREMMAHYPHHQRRDGGVPLPPPTFQFADFAAYQRQWLQSAEGLRQVEYWRQKLTGCPTVLDLPLDSPRPAQPSYRGGHELMTIVADSLPRLKELAETERVTMFMIFLTGFCALLHRHTGAEELCIGTGIANRRLPDTDGIVGMLINTVVLRADCSGGPTFLELLRRMRTLTLEAYAHQEAPFDKVVEAVSPLRDPSINPLHQVTFNFQNNPMPAVEFPGVSARLERPLFNGSAKYDLYVAGWPRSTARLGDWQRDDDSVVLSWEYNADVFEPETIRVLQAQYRCLLEQATAFPNTLLSDLTLEPDAPPAIAAETPSGPLLHERFASQAALRPQAIAVSCGAETLTYQSLDTFSDAMACRLQRLGHGPEDRIGIMAPRGIPLVVGLLGILKCGAAYVPLDASLPTCRLRAMVRSLGLRTILAPSALAAATEALGAQFQCLEWVGETTPSFAAPTLTDTALAYILFTSGSTGEPRAVAVPHQAVTRLVTNQEFASMTAAETWLLHSPLSFDASTLELWAPLSNGGRLVILPGEIPALDEISTVLAAQHVTSLWLTAGVFRLMVDERLETLGGLRQILTGGDVVPMDAVRRILERFPNLRVVNGYGPTENTTFTCCQIIKPEDLQRRSIPIGRPLRGTTVWVLDEQLRPVPTGVPGELCTGGLGLALGYFDQPEATHERFIQHPQLGRLYRTGDQCRVLADGCIEFLGRVDRQVKVRGLRIEPAEVEQALEKCPGVKQAVVVTRYDPGGDKSLVAYWVPMSLAAILTPEELRRQASQWLPHTLLPSRWIPLPEMPLTANGKVDYAALPEPNIDVTSSGRAPTTPQERLVASIWQEVLGTEILDTNADFFTVGGHSLAALRVLSLLQTRSGTALSAAHFFQDSTLQGLAQAITPEIPHGPSRQTLPRLIVPLRAGKSDRPVLIIPGGWGQDNEILVFSALVRQIETSQPIYAARSGVLENELPPATSLTEHAERLADVLVRMKLTQRLTLIAECAASTVALALTHVMELRGFPPERLILLDPGPLEHLRSVKERFCKAQASAPALQGPPPEPVTLYYALLAQVPTQPLTIPLHIILSTRFPNSDEIRASWQSQAQGQLHIHRVPGDHQAYLREMAPATASVLNRILVPATAAGSIPTVMPSPLEACPLNTESTLCQQETDRKVLEEQAGIIKYLSTSLDACRRELEAKESVIRELDAACRERLALIEKLSAKNRRPKG